MKPAATWRNIDTPTSLMFNGFMHHSFHLTPLGYHTASMLPIATKQKSFYFIGSNPMPRHKLTDAFLRTVKTPAEGQTEYWDTLTPGFGVRVSYGGRKAFGVLTRINGKLHRFTIGAYPKMSLSEARDQAEKMIKDASQRHISQRARGGGTSQGSCSSRNTFQSVAD